MLALSNYIYHTYLLSRAELREFIGGWRASTGVALYLCAFAGAAYLFVGMQRDFGVSTRKMEELLNDTDFLQAMSSSAMHQLPTMMRYLATQPSAVWLFQLVGVLWYPIFITLLSFDAVASDYHRGTQRYVIQRASRASYLSSKYVSHSVFYIGLHCLALAMLYVAAVVWGVPTGIVQPLIMYGVVMIAFILVLTAATIFVSSTCRSAGKALIWIQLFWVGAIIAGIFAPWANPIRGDWLMGLVMPATPFGAAALVGFLGWTTVMAVISHLLWERRDL